MNKILFYIIIVVFLSTGCSIPHSYRPVCKHTALFCAQAVRDITGQPTRIVLYKRDGKLVHTQSETFRAGKWRPLYIPPILIFEGTVDIESAEIDGYCTPDMFRKVYYDWMYEYKILNTKERFD